MNAKTTEHQALNLPANEGAKLALELIQSLDQLPAEEIDARWLDEAERRAAQLDNGTEELISCEVVAAEASVLLRQ